MAITNLTANPIRSDVATANTSARGPRASGGESNAPQTPVATDESLTLTAAARTVSSAVREGGDATPFDSERVASIRQALDDGSYRIDTRQLAANMIRLEAQFA